MSERTYGSFEDAEGAHGYSRQDIDEMSRQEKVRMMTEWFLAHFEDPAHRTPYESAEGGYQWIWGGPHNADEEIQGEFYEVVDSETMQEAADEVQRDVFEWAPKERPGDYQDEDERVRSGEIIDADAEWPPIIAVPEPPLAEPGARQEVVRRLDELEALIRPLIVQHRGMMGHNQPPEPMEAEQPCSREEWLALNEAVQALGQQTREVEPDDVQIASASLALGAIGRKLAGWLLARAEKGIDAALVACGTAGGVRIVVDLPKVADSIGQVIHAVSRWLETFLMPF